jgi:hypothetical protein
MATPTIVGFDPTQPLGSRFLSMLVVQEIAAVAPQFFLPGAITQSMLAAGAVTNPALGVGCVTSINLAADSVTQAALADNSVGSAQLQPNALTAANAAPGIPTATDNAGNPIALTLMVLTAAQYSVIAGGTPSATTLYFVTD